MYPRTVPPIVIMYFLQGGGYSFILFVEIFSYIAMNYNFCQSKVLFVLWNLIEICLHRYILMLDKILVWELLRKLLILLSIFVVYYMSGLSLRESL